MGYKTYELQSAPVVVPAKADIMTMTFDFSGISAIVNIDSNNSPISIKSVYMDIPKIRGAKLLETIQVPIEYFRSSDNVQFGFTRTNINAFRWTNNLNAIMKVPAQTFDLSQSKNPSIKTQDSIQVQFDGINLSDEYISRSVTMSIYVVISEFDKQIP